MRRDQEQMNNASTGSTLTLVCVQHILDWASETSTPLLICEKFSHARKDNIVTRYDTMLLSSFMDAFVYVTGLNTKDQINTIYDVYQSLILETATK